MNLHTIWKKILCSTKLMEDFFLFFELLKLYGSLNVIGKIWIVKILSNLNVNNSKNISAKYMKLHTIGKRIWCSTNLIGEFLFL